ncbi:MAG: hypothetical protein M3R50_02375 [Bacteroidota bacterium]|nr:hypothetical protein [Bacteroidota bacterium]
MICFSLVLEHIDNLHNIFKNSCVKIVAGGHIYIGELTNILTITNALYALIEVAQKQKWQIFDTGLGEMIDLDNPSKNGYQNFQEYLSYVLNSHR